MLEQLNTIRETDINNALCWKSRRPQVQKSIKGVTWAATSIIRLRERMVLSNGPGPIACTGRNDLTGSRRHQCRQYKMMFTVLQDLQPAHCLGRMGPMEPLLSTLKIKSPRYYNYSRRWPEYKLQRSGWWLCDGDKMQQIQEILKPYECLEETHNQNPCFYFDMVTLPGERN